MTTRFVGRPPDADPNDPGTWIPNRDGSVQWHPSSDVTPLAEPSAHLITVGAANDMAASFYHMGYRRGQRENLDQLLGHFDTNQRYSGDYIRRQIRELREES